MYEVNCLQVHTGVVNLNIYSFKINVIFVYVLSSNVIPFVYFFKG